MPSTPRHKTTELPRSFRLGLVLLLHALACCADDITVNALTTADSTPPLSGTISNAAASIAITVNNVAYQAVNQGAGTWLLPNHSIATPLADGVYDVQATATVNGATVATDDTQGELTVAGGIQRVGTVPVTLVAPGGAAATVDLAAHFDDPVYDVVQFEFRTNPGVFDVQLYEAETPLTVANFLAYVTADRYADSFIHRSVANFVIQGGGFTYDGGPQSVPAHAAVQNEPGISNVRGTIAMAKLGGDPDSATNQWFFNLQDNSGNLDNQNGGFTAFGQVLGTGMDVVDALAAVPTYDYSNNWGSAFTDLPLISANNTYYLLSLATVRELSGLEFAVTLDPPGVLTADVSEEGVLSLSRDGGSAGDSTVVTVTATGADARQATTVFLAALADTATGSMTGTVWHDANADSQRQGNEPGLPDVTVFLDLNANAQQDPGEPQVVTRTDDPATPATDEAGLYTFSNLPPHTFSVRLAPSSSLNPTFPGIPGAATPHQIALADGQQLTGRDFGLAPAATVTLDLDAGWNVFSLPRRPATDDVPSLLGALHIDLGTTGGPERNGAPGPTMLSWTGATYEAATEATPLTPYWVYMAAAAVVEVPLFDIAPPALSVLQGWNAVGVPEQVHLTTLDAAVSRTAWTWQSGRYRSSAVLEPGRGYWLESAGPAGL